MVLTRKTSAGHLPGTAVELSKHWQRIEPKHDSQ